MGFVVGGFEFNTEEEAEAAKKEAQAVLFVRERIKGVGALKALDVYNKLIKDNMLSTPVGIRYLSELREQLIAMPDINAKDVLPIPIKKEVVVKEISARTDNETVVMSSKKNKKNYELRFKNSFIINIIFAIAIIAMVILVNTSNNINILNYKDKIVNQYEDWEKDLTERENNIKELEKKYNVNTTRQ